MPNGISELRALEAARQLAGISGAFTFKAFRDQLRAMAPEYAAADADDVNKALDTLEGNRWVEPRRRRPAQRTAGR